MSWTDCRVGWSESALKCLFALLSHLHTHTVSGLTPAKQVFCRYFNGVFMIWKMLSSLVKLLYETISVPHCGDYRFIMRLSVGISISISLTVEFHRRLRGRTSSCWNWRFPPGSLSSVGRSVRGCRVILWWWNKKHFSTSSFWSFIQFKRGPAEELPSRLQAAAQKPSFLTFSFVNDNKSRRAHVDHFARDFYSWHSEQRSSDLTPLSSSVSCLCSTNSPFFNT